MSTSELPNAYDLQDFFNIYENKSDAKRAIITYAYRNALRAIPALAKVDLKNTLDEQKTLYCYNLCRVLFLTQQYLGRKNNINTKNIQHIEFPKITATHESFNDSICSGQVKLDNR